MTLDPTSRFLLVLVTMISRQLNQFPTDGLDILTVPCPTGFSVDQDGFFPFLAVQVTESLSGSGAKFLLEEKFAELLLGMRWKPKL
jgi:hypothetical protein